MSDLDAVGEAFAATVNYARSHEKLLAAGRHVGLVLEDIAAALDVEPFLSPELGAMLASLEEVNDAIGRARKALDAKYSATFGLDDEKGSG